MPPVVVTEWLPGESLERVLERADDALAERLGIAVAEVAARLSGIPFARPGALRGIELAVEPWPVGAGVLDAAEELIGTGFPGPSAGLLEVADEADGCIAGVRRFCLVHADFNPKNLLVDPATGAVTGLVDWEYAHAGAPVTDLGNMRRFDGTSTFGRSFTERFVEAAPALPDDPLRTAQALDLVSLIDLAGREARGSGNPVTARATQLLVRLASQGRLDDPN